MNSGLLILGLVKLSAGVFVGGLMVLTAHLLVTRALRLGAAAQNPAAATMFGATLLALALLLRGSLEAMYATLDVMVRQGTLDGAGVVALVLRGAAHLVAGLVLAAAILAMATAVFNRLTPGVDEVALVREGRLAPALVLAALVITLAVVLGPGLEATLDSLIPYPQLPDTTEVAPP